MDGYEILKVCSAGPTSVNLKLTFRKVSRDEVSAGSPNLPRIIRKDIPVFEEFIAGSNIITKTMLACLSNALSLNGADRFEASHRNDHKSNTTLAMFRYIPTNLSEKCVGHQKHTDIGSLTLLFSEQWGLQVMPPGTTSWEFVPPRPGHAVINVGDSLRFASGHVLQSCIHQVVPMDVAEDRYSIAYFLRPESEKKYKDSEGRWISASQWHDEKYEIFKKPHVEQVKNSILTGGMESEIKVA